MGNLLCVALPDPYIVVSIFILFDYVRTICIGIIYIMFPNNFIFRLGYHSCFFQVIVVNDREKTILKYPREWSSFRITIVFSPIATSICLKFHYIIIPTLCPNSNNGFAVIRFIIIAATCECYCGEYT